MFRINFIKFHYHLTVIYELCNATIILFHYREYYYVLNMFLFNIKTKEQSNKNTTGPIQAKYCKSEISYKSFMIYLLLNITYTEQNKKNLQVIN